MRKKKRTMDPANRIIQDYASKIDEGVVFEICVRLPVKSIFKFRCVSKLWLSILSEHGFLTTKIQRLSPSPWVLFSNLESRIPLTHSVAWEAASPDVTVLIHEHGGFSLKFLHPEICPYYQHLFVLASSNGALLCSKVSYDYKCSYILCNPLTKTKLSVPQVPVHIFRGSRNYGFICEPSCSSSSILTSMIYKVVCVPKSTSETTKFNIDIFSSDLGHWNTYKVTAPEKVTWDTECKNIVIHNGVAYWMIDGNRLIAYYLNNGTHQCRLIKLPNTHSIYNRSYGYLGISGGSLVYIPSQRSWLTVWILDKCSNICDWSLVSDQSFSFIVTDGLPSWFRRDQVFKAVAINPKDRAELIVGCYKAGLCLSSYSCQGLVYFNIKTKCIRSVDYFGETTTELLITPWPGTLR